MHNRIIEKRARGSSVQLLGVLSSLFVLELMQPSPELYLISPWLSKVPLLNNRFGQFRAIVGNTHKAELHLADILVLLAEKGMQIRIISRPNQPNTDEFLASLPKHSAITFRQTMTMHKKGLLTHHFYLRGSMNFTFSGVNLNDESIELTTDLATIASALREAKVSWEEIGG